MLKRSAGAYDPMRDFAIAVIPCGAQAWRCRGSGVLDLAGGWRSLQALAQASSMSAEPIGIGVPAGCR
jgi:hypothetical protein